MSAGSSRLPGFYKLGRARRLEVLRAAVGIEVDERTLSAIADGEDFDLFDRLIENAIGSFPLPLGVAVNFLIDGRDVVVPMAIEESSVVAAASNMARRVRVAGGFTTEVVEDLMIGQVELRDVADPQRVAAMLEAREAEIVAAANAAGSGLVPHGGGCRSVEVRTFPDFDAVIVHLLIDCADAMGANSVNTMCEAVAPLLAEWTGATPGLRILSNFADRRRFRARCTVRPEDLEIGDVGGDGVVSGIVAASRFASFDPYRAATHNKGIMNGVDPVVIATGNDWRAVEAGAHAYAARSGRYTSLSRWWQDPTTGCLQGELEMPLQLGIVGGVTRLHPVARFSLRLLGVRSAQELGRICVAVGLAQNLGALRALATEGIQRGHMRLHRQNLELAREDGE